ncbi:mitochondrial matrix Mmp37 [Gorgonomyces haynaldii]|nr:mitochondrial matrix Mmp37 [Gorgonomyces haynaldii]
MILSKFEAPIRLCIQYGSGAFQQKGYTKKPMVDYIFGVTHPEHWHDLNLRQHPSHYSFLKHLGAESIARVQRLGPAIYYNTNIIFGDERIKYGVVGIEDLLKDLNEWDSLYLAGRMHKPVNILRPDARVQLANQTNLTNALRTSLLMLPERFTQEDLFLKIAGLSYKGDFRMTFGENPHKVYNIVYAQQDAFYKLYRPIIEDLPNVNYVSETELEQDFDDRLRQSLVTNLPKRMQERLLYRFKWHLSKREQIVQGDDTDFIKLLVKHPGLGQCVNQALTDIVSGPAIVQALKGIFTAGPVKSIRYATEKIQKSFNR